MDPQKEPQTQYLPYPPNTTAPAPDDEIDLRELFKAIWQGKWIIIATTFLFAVASVVYAISQPNIYKADVLLAPAESSSSGLSKMAGQFGGLAALAGVNFGAGESSQTELAVQVIKSRKFIDTFIKKHDILVPLMAVKNWDLVSNKLILDEDIYSQKTGDWLREPEGLRGAKPSSQEAYEVFVKDILSVSQDKDSGLYTVSVMHYSPFIAHQWASWIIEDINQTMRERTISETSQNLEYLNTQLNETAVAEMQSTFYKLIEEQTKSLMLAKVQEEFVFKVVDPAVIPEKKAKPARALICILGTLLGFVISLIILVFKINFLRTNSSI